MREAPTWSPALYGPPNIGKTCEHHEMWSKRKRERKRNTTIFFFQSTWTWFERKIKNRKGRLGNMGRKTKTKSEIEVNV